MSDKSRRRSPDSGSRRHSKSPSRRRSKSPKSRHRSRSRESRRSGHRKRSPSPDRSRERRHRRSVSPERSRERRRRRSVSPDRSRERRHDGSASPDRYRHSKRRKRSPSTSSDSDSQDERRRKRKDSKRRKDKKKDKKKKKKKSKLSAVGDEYGKYGIIHESDIFTKEAEFQAWLIEVKGENIEILNNNKRKEMFVDFMEDYNTATMPHEKFYDIGKHERKQQFRAGDPLPITTTDSFDFHNDEERLRTQHRQAARMAASRQPTLTLSEEQIKELTRVNRERVEADRMRKMGLKPKESMGVRYEEE